MKLDKRILPGKRPLGGFETEEAKEFIGEAGYFSDHVQDFESLHPGQLSTLLNTQGGDYPFMIAGDAFRYFLPRKWVKTEKKWRPFTLDEFVKRFDLEVGTRVFLIRSKRTPENQQRLLLTGIVQEKDPDLCGVCLGSFYFKFPILFQMFDVRFGEKDWQPFGVEDTSE